MSKNCTDLMIQPVSRQHDGKRAFIVLSYCVLFWVSSMSDGSACIPVVERPPASSMDVEVDLETLPESEVVDAAIVDAEDARDENVQKQQPKRDRATEDVAAESVSIKSVSAIYAMTKKAKSAKDFSAIINDCEIALDAARTAKSLSGKKSQLIDDLRGLLAWSQCKRGQERLELAHSLKSAGNQAQFKAVLDAALLDFDQSIENADDRWKTYYSRAVVHADFNNDAQAIADLDRAIELNPKSRNARFNRGELLSWKGDYRSAISDYEFVLESNSKDVQAINGLAHAWLEMGETDTALELYNRVTELQPQNSVAWQVRGEAHQKIGDWEAAHADFQRGIDLQKSAQSYLKAAWLLSTCPDPDYFEPYTALEYANQGKRYEADSVQCLEVLAAASAANGEFATAIDFQKRAISKYETQQADFQLDAGEMQVRLAAYEKEEPYLQVR